MEKVKIYLDDVRTPVDPSWIVVRSYDEFVQKINTIGLENIELISLDHDLGDTAMNEWLYGVTKNYSINYDNITEKTGMDCTKWLVDEFYNVHPEYLEMARADKKRTTPYFPFPKVYVHSANPIGSANMMGYINNFLKNEAQPEDCVRVRIEHTVEPNQYGM